jgi:ribose 5-phosphate isomerase RpiB
MAGNLSLVKTWMAAEYPPGARSEPKVQRICDYDQEDKN